MKGYLGMIWMYINSVKDWLTVGKKNAKDKKKTKKKKHAHKKQLLQMEESASEA